MPAVLHRRREGPQSMQAKAGTRTCALVLLTGVVSWPNRNFSAAFRWNAHEDADEFCLDDVAGRRRTRSTQTATEGMEARRAESISYDADASKVTHTRARALARPVCRQPAQ